MAPEDAPAQGLPVAGRARKKKPRGSRRAAGPPSRGKGDPSPPALPPECIVIAGEGSCREWEDLLPRYPLIDSVQREDFPDHGISFVHLAHFYRTTDMAEECSRAREEFEEFIREIGYEFDSAGDSELRWFEGIGIRVS
jgi:hypothetical protein